MRRQKTVCFEIWNPFKVKTWRAIYLIFQGRRGEVFPDPWITIWHQNPAGGPEKECDWFGGRLASEEVDRVIVTLADYRSGYFPPGNTPGASRHSPQDFEEVFLEMARDINFALTGEPFPMSRRLQAEIKKAIHPDSHEIVCARQAQQEAQNSARSAPSAALNPESYNRLCLALASRIKRLRRPWWRHPRWHLHHWRLQFHPWQRFKRRHISRCHKCGGTFQDEIPSSLGQNIYHQSCLPEKRG